MAWLLLVNPLGRAATALMQGGASPRPGSTTVSPELPHTQAKLLELICPWPLVCSFLWLIALKTSIKVAQSTPYHHSSLSVTQASRHNYCHWASFLYLNEPRIMVLVSRRSTNLLDESWHPTALKYAVLDMQLTGKSRWKGERGFCHNQCEVRPGRRLRR